MSNATATAPQGLVSWNTAKTATGYRFKVTAFVYGEGTETLKSGELPTRARAKSQAQAWVRYYKALQRQAR